MGEKRMNHHRQRILRETAIFVDTNTNSETKQSNNNKIYPNKKSLDVSIIIELDIIILSVLIKKEEYPLQCLNGFPKLPV